MSETTEAALVPVEPPAIYAERRWHWIHVPSVGRKPMMWDRKQKRWQTGYGTRTPAEAAANKWKWWAPIEDAPKRAVKVDP